MKKIYVCNDTITGIFSAIYDAWKEGREEKECGIAIKGMLEQDENYKKYFVYDDPYTDEELAELAGYSFDDLNKAATSLSIEDVISRHSN